MIRIVIVAIALARLLIGAPSPAIGQECVLANEGDPLVLDGQSDLVEREGSTSGASNNYNPGYVGCVRGPGGGSIAQPGRDVVYQIVIPSSVVFNVRVTPDATDWDPGIYLIKSCLDFNAVSCREETGWGADVNYSGKPETLSDIRVTVTEPDTLYLVIDSALTSPSAGSGPFTIRITYSEEGDDCESPIALQLGGESAVYSTCSAAGDLGATSLDACEGALESLLPGRDRVFTLTVPGNVSWWADVTPIAPEADWDVAVVVDTVCAGFDTACVAAANTGGPGETERLPGIENASAVPVTYYIFVDSPDAVDPTHESGCGRFRIWLHAPSPVIPTSWGSIKARYRSDGR